MYYAAKIQIYRWKPNFSVFFLFGLTQKTAAQFFEQPFFRFSPARLPFFLKTQDLQEKLLFSIQVIYCCVISYEL
jgi:hypothetical protein